jgi:hypothetical protein
VASGRPLRLAGAAEVAGDDPTRIHHLDCDPEFLIELPERVRILQMCVSDGCLGGTGV